MLYGLFQQKLRDLPTHRWPRSRRRMIESLRVASFRPADLFLAEYILSGRPNCSGVPCVGPYRLDLCRNDRLAWEDVETLVIPSGQTVGDVAANFRVSPHIVRAAGILAGHEFARCSLGTRGDPLDMSVIVRFREGWTLGEIAADAGWSTGLFKREVRDKGLDEHMRLSKSLSVPRPAPKSAARHADWLKGLTEAGSIVAYQKTAGIDYQAARYRARVVGWTGNEDPEKALAVARLREGMAISEAYQALDYCLPTEMIRRVERYGRKAGLTIVKGKLLRQP